MGNFTKSAVGMLDQAGTSTVAFRDTKADVFSPKPDRWRSRFTPLSGATFSGERGLNRGRALPFFRPFPQDSVAQRAKARRIFPDFTPEIPPDSNHRNQGRAA